MRKPFTVGEIVGIRGMLHLKWPMADICILCPLIPRDQIVEAIDAIKRHASNHDAMRHANQVLAYQDAGIPLINGREAWKVAAGRGYARYAPEFER